MFFFAAIGTSGARGADGTYNTIVPGGTKHIAHATWYAGKFIGRTTKGGKRYREDAVFVATRHPYPFGTRLMVTNLHNHKSIVVPVEDREPAHRKHPDRILDLSYAAAKKLDMISAGVVLVSYFELPSSPEGVIRE